MGNHPYYVFSGWTLAERRAIAIREVRIIITKDSDFFDSYLAKGVPPRVLLLQFGNIKNNELLAYFEQEFFNIQTLFNDGAELIIFDKLQVITY